MGPLKSWIFSFYRNTVAMIIIIMDQWIEAFVGTLDVLLFNTSGYLSLEHKLAHILIGPHNRRSTIAKTRPIRRGWAGINNCCRIRFVRLRSGVEKYLLAVCSWTYKNCSQTVIPCPTVTFVLLPNSTRPSLWTSVKRSTVLFWKCRGFWQWHLYMDICKAINCVVWAM